jgi:hypothetical protein
MNPDGLAVWHYIQKVLLTTTPAGRKVSRITASLILQRCGKNWVPAGEAGKRNIVAEGIARYLCAALVCRRKVSDLHFKRDVRISLTSEAQRQRRREA